MNSTKPEKDPQKNLLHILLIAATTIATIIISLYYLSSGWFIVFQNLFYIPIIMSCVYYAMRGFVYSIGLAIIYIFLILTFTSDSNIILQALIRVVLFITIGGIITFLSTQLKRAERGLRESEAKYHSLFENAIEGIFQTTPEGRFLSANPALARLIGFDSPQELMEQFTDIGRQHYVNPEDRQTYKNILERDGVIKGFETQLLNKDGNPIWASISARAVRSDEGTGIHYEGTVEDITERKQAEEALQKSEGLLYEMTTQIPGVVYQFYARPNGEMGCYYVSDRSEQIFGLKPDLEGYFERFIALVIPEHRDGFMKSIEKSVKESSEWKYEGMLQKPSGEKIWFSGNSTPTPRENEMVFNGILQDITERKELEEQLQTISLTDELTVLYNRRGFFTLAQQQMKVAERTKKDMLLFFADLDKMKQINDTLGHQEGDKALIEVATILKEVFRESDIIGRMGGDEFAILAIDTTDESREVLMNRLHNTLDNYNKHEGRNYTLSLSIGMAHYNPETPSTLDELMAQADTLMYEQKRSKQVITNHQ